MNAPSKSYVFLESVRKTKPVIGVIAYREENTPYFMVWLLLVFPSYYLVNQWFLALPTNDHI